MSEHIKNCLITAMSLAFGALLFLPTPAQAADFQVAVKRFSVPQCSLTGSMLNVDPTTGTVSIDLSADFSCYPLIVSSIANSASLTIIGSTTVGGGTTGAGTVNVQLNTGLSGITPGVTCAPDGYSASNVVPTNGWTGNLCANNCGATVTRSVDVQNTSSTVDGNITFKAKCTYQDQSNVNLSSVRTNIQSIPSVSVLHGTTPPANYCQSVSELANPKGLTPAMRQQTGNVTGGIYPGTGKDFLNYTSIFGSSANTYPTGSGDTAGFGFPGDNMATLTSWIDRDKYVALQFRVPTNALWTNKSGYYTMNSSIPSIGLIVAVAPCPGQFDNDANFPLPGLTCTGYNEGGDVTWRIAGTGIGCNLVPGKTYFLNLMNADRNNPSQTTCTSSSCRFQIINNHN